MDEQLPTTPVEVVKRIYQAFAEVDLDVIPKLTSPDIVITQDDALPWGGRYEGHDGLGEFALALLGAIDSKVTVHEQELHTFHPVNGGWRDELKDHGQGLSRRGTGGAPRAGRGARPGPAGHPGGTLG